MKQDIYFCLLLFSLQFSYSQTHIYKHFGVDEGLSSSEVYDIYQDKLGYIWFATDKGLSRYNGYEFENFTTQNGLPGNTILDFYPQENGQVWCYEYHSQNLFYFDEVFNGFKTYLHNDVLKSQVKAKSVVKSVVLDKNNTLNVGGFTINGLIKITKDGIATRQFGLDTTKTGADINMGFNSSNGSFFSVYHNYESQEQSFIFDSEYGPSSRLDFVLLNKNYTIFIDKKLGIISQNKNIEYYETEQNPIGIKRINNDLFFVGYYTNGAEIRNISGVITERFLPNKSVSNFLIDAEGSYWFTTIDDGVFHIKNPDIKVFTEQHISSIVKDDRNDLYLGFENGNIGRLANKTIETLYTGLSTNAALVEFNKDQNTLYGYGDRYLKDYTHRKKSFFIGAKKLPENTGSSILASIVFGFYQIKNDSIVTYLLKEKVQDVCVYDNNILVGTSSGLFIQNDSIFEPYQPLDILKSRIDDIDINKSTNTLYMATQGKGVIVYNDSIYNITQGKGLTNDIVSEIHIENDSTVWACTNTGLNKISFKSNNSFDITTITKADGLLSNDIDDVEIINDTVWVATKKGLCYFSKDVLTDKNSSNILSLSLNEVFVNNKKIHSRNLKLKHDQNNIDFKLQAISHKNTDNVNYFYRLKEVDTAWTKTTNRVISFPSLSQGNYTFEARANVLNNDNELITSYNFKILPPYWKSWWFYGICFLLISGMVYIFFRFRVLTYNQAVFRELLRLAVKRLKRKERFYKFRSNGEDFKIQTRDILYINSQGNYLDIVTKKKTYTIRCKIGDFVGSTPDALEYLRVHRSYIIRIDQVSSKGKNWVVIKDNKIPVGETYLGELDKIHF